MPDFANISDANLDQRFIGVAQRLMHDLGLSADQARGVAWRLVHESDITPINERVPVVPGSRGGFGFAQWTGPRRVEFERWAKDNGLSVNDPEANYRYLVHDLTANFPGTLDALKKAKDWRSAYNTFYNQFEMSGGTPGKGTPVMAQSSLQKQLDDMFADAPKGGTATPAAPSASAAPMDHKQALDEMFAPEPQVAAVPSEAGRPMSARADLGWYMNPKNTGGAVDAFRAGTGQAMRDVGTPINRMNAWLIENVPGAGTVAKAVGYDPNAVVAGQTAAREQFDKQYGDNAFATVGRIGGQTTATLPVLGAVNPLLARGAGGVVSAIEPYAPGLAAGARGLGSYLSGAAGMPTATEAASAGRQIMSRGAQGALLGGETAALTSGQSDNPLLTQMLQGGAAGGAFGAAVPAVGAAANTLTGRSARIDPAIAELARMARDVYGIQPTAPQLGLSPALAYANSALKMVPGSGVGASEANTRGQWIRAVSRTFGEDTDRITPEVLSSARGRIGGVMNDVEQNARVSLDDAFLNRAAQIETAARTSLPDSEYAVIRRQLDNVLKNVEGDDALAGTTYGNLIHKGSPLDAALNSKDANIRNFAGQIKSALQDSLARSLPAEEAAAYQNARTQYKNLMTVRPLVLRADATGGPTPSVGDISPASLRAAVNKSYGDNVAMASPGDVPLNDLAKIGQMLKVPPSSGTSERGSMMYAGAKAAQILGGLAAGGGAATAGGLGPLSAAMTGLGTLGAGVAGGRALGAYLRNPRLANNMIDASLNPLVGAPVNPLMVEYGAPMAAISMPSR